MKRAIVLLMLAAWPAFSQVVRKPGEFRHLSATDRINVELIASDEERVEINGTRSSDVEVVNKNGELKLRMKITQLLDGEDIEARIYFRELHSIQAGEGSFVGCATPFKQSNLSLTARTGGNIRVQMAVDEAEVRAVTGGILDLRGTVDELEVNIGTGGIVNAKELVSRRAEVEIKAGGEAKVHATEYVQADVKAGGDVLIYGKPAKIDQKTTLGGSVGEAR